MPFITDFMSIPSTTPRTAEPPAPAESVVLSTRDLSVWYGSSLALKDITIDIPRNRITALIGPSGCGKSTLLRCFNRMNDLIPGARMDGVVTFDGQEINGPGTDPVALRRRIGMVFQKPNPFPKSVYHNVSWGANQRLQGRPRRAGRALAPPCRLVGRGQGQAPPIRPRPLGRPAATALHRPDLGRRA